MTVAEQGHNAALSLMPTHINDSISVVRELRTFNINRMVGATQSLRVANV